MMPNFFIVGAAKSGTTSLWYYLKQHPQIFFPENKEPNYFAFAGEDVSAFEGPAPADVLYQKLHYLTLTDKLEYEKLFDDAGAETAIGDASVRYLYFPEACERIAKAAPDARIIIILRNPVDRLYSHYLMMKGLYDLEPLGIEGALRKEDHRVAAGWDWDWHYTRVGMYYEQVRRYLETFGESRVRVYVYEDFCNEPLQVIREIFGYLGVDPDFEPDMSKRGMQTYWPKSARIDWLLRSRNIFNRALRKVMPEGTYQQWVEKGMRMNSAKPPKLPEALRAELTEKFQPDVAKLEGLLGRKLPW